MPAPKWMFVCLLTCFLSCSEASEEVKEVKPGDDVTLQCQGPKDATVEMLEWIKPELESEEYVFFFREMQIYETYQHPDFNGRVELVDPQMKEGDFSVILKDVTINDQGTYECYVAKSDSGRSKRETPTLISSVTLYVNDSVSPSDQKYITADTRADIPLPCQAPSSSPIKAIKWIRRDLKDYVFLHHDGQSLPNNQHPYYKNWVELKDREMKDGDASLILKDGRNMNSGTYECWVHQGGINRKTSVINLYVKPGGGAGHTGDGVDTGGGDKDGRVGLIVVLSLCLVLLIIIVIVYLIYRKYNVPPEDAAD